MKLQPKRLALLLAPALVVGLAAAASWSMSRAPSVSELTWEDLVPEGAKVEDWDDPLANMITLHDQIGVQTTAPQSMALVTDWVGQRVRIPGYVVPLEFDGTKVTSFLLVPYFGACIHVPPPPPNQIVYVHFREPVEVDDLLDAVWAEGTFEADMMATEIAQVGYRLADATVKPYDPPD